MNPQIPQIPPELSPDTVMERNLCRRYTDYNPKNPFEKLLKKNMYKCVDLEQENHDVNDIYRSIYSKQVLKEKGMEAYFDEINDEMYKIFVNLEIDPEVSSLIHFKEDMLIVLVFDRITIKIHMLKDFRKFNMESLYSILCRNECNFLEEIREVRVCEDLEIVFVVSKTINMLQNFNDVAGADSNKVRPTDDILEDIENAAWFLRENNWVHGDMLLDNVGFDLEKQCYVLFDFEKSRYIDEEEEMLERFQKDMGNLSRSFYFYVQNRK